MRHKRFAETLSRQENEVRLENILTITSETAGFVASIKDALNHFGQDIDGYTDIDINAAYKIFEVISCSRRNTKVLSAPGSPLPFLVQSSDQGVIQCLAGIDCEPIRYLLESLRINFPKEYDSNQRTRERSFQRAVRRILTDHCDDLDFRDNVKIKVKGRILTDIDMVFLEKRTGELVLCQLKHQELYGLNLHAMKIRTERLVQYSEKWLATVNSWLAGADEKEIRSTLRLPKDFPTLKLSKVVLTRHYSSSLKTIAAKFQAEYSNWPMFANSVFLAQKSGEDIGLREILNFVSQSHSAYQPPLHLEEPQTCLLYTSDAADE